MNQTADTRDSDAANKPTTNLTTVRPRSSLENGIVSGLISGAMNIPCCIALTSIIFLGDLSPYFPLGIGRCLVGNAMVSAVASLCSGCRYGIATIIVAMGPGAIAGMASFSSNPLEASKQRSAVTPFSTHSPEIR